MCLSLVAAISFSVDQSDWVRTGHGGRFCPTGRTELHPPGTGDYGESLVLGFLFFSCNLFCLFLLPYPFIFRLFYFSFSKEKALLFASRYLGGSPTSQRALWIRSSGSGIYLARAPSITQIHGLSCARLLCQGRGIHCFHSSAETLQRS